MPSAAAVHTSGFLACYLAALVLGNMAPAAPAGGARLRHAMGWLAQIGLFVLLGLLASPGRTGRPGRAAPSSSGWSCCWSRRPLSVLVSMTPFRMPWRDQAFLSWAGLRGAVPVVLATVPLTRGRARRRVDLRPGLRAGRRLHPGAGPRRCPGWRGGSGWPTAYQTLDLAVETTPLEELGAELIQVTVGPGSRLHGVEVFELRLPQGANVTLVVRERQRFVPEPNTTIRRGDQLLIVATASGARRDRVRAVSERDGRLAGCEPSSPGRSGSQAAAPAGRSRRYASRIPRRLAYTWHSRPTVLTREEPCRRTPTRAPRAITASRSPVLQRRLPDAVPRVRGPPAQAVQRRRHRLQGQRLLPHRLARRVLLLGARGSPARPARRSPPPRRRRRAPPPAAPRPDAQPSTPDVRHRLCPQRGRQPPRHPQAAAERVSPPGVCVGSGHD